MKLSFSGRSEYGSHVHRIRSELARRPLLSISGTRVSLPGIQCVGNRFGEAVNGSSRNMTDRIKKIEGERSDIAATLEKNLTDPASHASDLGSQRQDDMLEILTPIQENNPVLPQAVRECFRNPEWRAEFSDQEFRFHEACAHARG